MKKVSFLLLTLLLMLSLTACREERVPDIASEKPTAGEQLSGQADEQEGTNADVGGELLFRDERVSIYAADDKSSVVTLVYGEHSQYLENFNYARPHCTTWEADADGDGTEELYLIHTIGSGTGVSVDTLIVLEPNGENPEIFCHDSEELRAKFNASVSGSYDPEQQTMHLSYGESAYTCDLSDFYNRDYISAATKTALISGHQIAYVPAEDDAVRLTFALSFESESITSLSSYLPEETAVSCLIRFDGTGFELLDDLKFAAGADIE